MDDAKTGKTCLQINPALPERQQEKSVNVAQLRHFQTSAQGVNRARVRLKCCFKEIKDTHPALQMIRRRRQKKSERHELPGRGYRGKSEISQGQRYLCEISLTL